MLVGPPFATFRAPGMAFPGMMPPMGVGQGAYRQPVSSPQCLVNLMMGTGGYGIAPVEQQNNPEYEAVRAAVVAVVCAVAAAAEEDGDGLEWAGSMPPLLDEDA